jgi:hypothetical protein
VGPMVADQPSAFILPRCYSPDVIALTQFMPESDVWWISRPVSSGGYPIAVSKLPVCLLLLASSVGFKAHGWDETPLP